MQGLRSSRVDVRSWRNARRSSLTKHENAKETAQSSDGDWNCDGRFDTADLIFAFQQNKYVNE